MRLLYYLPSGHRTESHIPHLSLSLPVFLLCCLPTSARSLFPSYSFTSLPPILPSLWHSCLLFFFFNSHLSFTASQWASHRSPSSVQSPSAPLLSPFPLQLTSFSLSLSLSSSSSLVVSSSISPSSFLVDSCLSRGNPFIHPSQLSAPLCLPSCLSVCSVCGSERTGGGVRRQEWANRQLSSQMLLSVLPVLLLFCSLAFSLCISSSWPPLHVAMQAPCLLVSKRREGSEERLGEKECGMESRR